MGRGDASRLVEILQTYERQLIEPQLYKWFQSITLRRG